jgi:hypothetical protein
MFQKCFCKELMSETLKFGTKFDEIFNGALILSILRGIIDALYRKPMLEVLILPSPSWNYMFHDL